MVNAKCSYSRKPLVKASEGKASTEGCDKPRGPSSANGTAEEAALSGPAQRAETITLRHNLTVRAEPMTSLRTALERHGFGPGR